MKKNIVIFAVLVLLISACGSTAPTSAPAATLAQVPQVAPAIATATSLPVALVPSATPLSVSAAPTAAPSPAPQVQYFPTVTFSKNVACYAGPDINYNKVANFSIGQSTQAQGQGHDSKWLIVHTMSPNTVQTCWVPLASVRHFPSANSLQVVEAAPLPTGVSLVVARQKITCGVDPLNGVDLGWSPSTTSGTYIVYRNGEPAALVYGGLYTDHKTPAAKTGYLLTYIIQPVNPLGLSPFTAVTSAEICGVDFSRLR